MEIVVANVKGGAGKTMITRELSLNLDSLIVDCDPYGYGLLEELFGEERVLTLGLEDEIPQFEGGDVVYDFGGFADNRILEASKNANLIIIPFIPTLVNMKGAVATYNMLSETQTPILFVVNSVVKEADKLQALDYIRENIQEDISYFAIPHTTALQTAENEATTILDFANSTPFRKHTYKKITSVMSAFLELIKEYK